MKYNDIKEQSVIELAKKRKSLSESLFAAKMKNSIGQLSNPIEIRDLRRNLARIKTALTSKKK
jgi:large subunit ribosomal protein L29